MDAVRYGAGGVPMVNQPTKKVEPVTKTAKTCLLYTSPSPRDVEESRMPSSA